MYVNHTQYFTHAAGRAGAHAAMRELSDPVLIAPSHDHVAKRQLRGVKAWEVLVAKASPIFG